MDSKVDPLAFLYENIGRGMTTAQAEALGTDNGNNAGTDGTVETGTQPEGSIQQGTDSGNPG